MLDWLCYKYMVKFIFFLVILVFFIVGWVNLQWGSKKEKVKCKGIDVFIVLDVFWSMLVEDIFFSRLDWLKWFF